MAPTRIALNMDILLAILSLSPPKTATSIMATCRFLYHEGAKVILRWPIRLYGFEQDLALLRFIQAEDLSRCAYVRNLSIFANGYSEAVARILVDVVLRMSSLEFLCLRGEHLLQRFPELLPAFASLRSVKMLIVEEAGDKSLELARTLQSELVTVKILLSSRVFGIRSFPVFNHPIQLLRRSASTLQNVECTGFWHDTPMNVHFFMSSRQVVYPNVHNLILRTNKDVPCLSPYIRAFPNLIHLRIEGNCYLSEGSQNQARIDMTLRGLIKEPLVWNRLQTYTGTLSALRALRITFPIPRLYFTNSLNDDAPRGLKEALAYARPIHLTIAFEGGLFWGPCCKDFLTALRGDGGSGLQSLSLMIDTMAADVDGNFDIGQCCSSIENVFSRLQLCSINIVMRDISVPETANTATFPSMEGRSDRSALTHEYVEATAHHPADPAQPEGAPWLFPYTTRKADAEHRAQFTLAERTLEDFDVRAFVGRLAASIPTLQHAVVSIERPSRWAGGIMRTARLGKHEDKSEKHVITVENVVLYEEYKVIPKRSGQVGLAALSRAWLRGLAAEP